MFKKIVVLLIFLIMLTCMIKVTVVDTYNNYQRGNENKATLSVAHVIDENMVIKALSGTGQIVGLDGEVEKGFIYKDEKLFGDVRYEFTVKAKFKFGFDISELKNNVIIDGNKIIFNNLNVIMISLNIPYDEMKINKKVGLLRRDINDQDKQLIISEIKNKLIYEINNDHKIQQEAILSSRRAVESILKVVPNVEEVVFNG